MEKLIAMKFVNWEVPDLDTLKDERVYTLKVKLNNGEKISQDDKNYLVYHTKNGIIKLHGWRFNFRDTMKKYIVKQYGLWQEYHAHNKTALRYNIHGKIDKIQEVK